MIPFSDQPGRPRRLFPFVMISFVLINIAVYIYQVSLGSGDQRFVMAWGLIPYELSTGRDIAPLISAPVYFTIITSMFLHGSILHIGGNMLFLWVFGDNVEDVLGHFWFLMFYLAVGILAGLSQVMIDPTSRVPGIGASGAIAGVLAAYLILFPHARVRTLLFLGPFFTITRISATILIGIWILFQFISGVVTLSDTEQSGVAYWAHIGGFFAGLIIIWIYRRSRGSAERSY